MVAMKLYAADLDFTPIVEELQIQKSFAPAVHQAAADAVDTLAHQRVDRRDIPLVTIDPPGSMDLDQAVCIEGFDGGYRVYYAIADVAAFVTPIPLVDTESRRRGQTIYLPDEPARLHPEEISEAAASLLPDVDRPAVLWSIDLDDDGEVTAVDLQRTLVRSRARYDYVGLQALIDQGNCPEPVQHLSAVGELRRRSALRRKAVSISMPSQYVHVNHDDGSVHLAVEPRVPTMDDNSEISLLAGMCAGQMMARAGVGVLRTLPGARRRELDTFIDSVRALGFDLQPGADYDEVTAFITKIKGTDARGMAVMRQALTLLRGAGYQRIGDEPLHTHAGVGGYYSHVTAPLRRLVDRYATEYCLAITAGVNVPTWVEEGIDQVIGTMESSSNLASRAERACLNLTEATVLKPWEGTNFQAAVLDSDPERESGKIFIENPPVICRSIGAPPRGQTAQVTLVRANPDKREVLFAWPAD